MKKTILLVFCAVVISFANFGLVFAQTTAPELMPPPLTSSPAGSNISINGTVYYVQAPPGGGAAPINPPQPTLRAYPSAAVFLSYGFNSWSNVTRALPGDTYLDKNANFMPFADGTLVNDSGTVYIINSSQKSGITSASVFLGLGYKWTNVISGDASFIPSGQLISSVSAHLPGTLINQSGTIYYIGSFGKIGFPSMQVFNSWGFNLNKVVLANSADLNITINSFAPIASAWSMGQLSPDVGPAIPLIQTN